MDPRVKTSVADLEKQFDLSFQCYEGRIHCKEIVNDIKNLRVKLKEKFKNESPTEADFSRLGSSFGSLLNLLQGADQPPTDQAVAAVKETQKKFEQLRAKWNELLILNSSE